MTRLLDFIPPVALSLSIKPSRKDSLIEPVQALRSHSRAIQNLHTHYGEAESGQERDDQRPGVQIRVTEPGAKDLENRNLRYIPEQRVFAKKNYLPSNNTLLAAASAYPINDHQA